jgi:hypothetical protein
LAAAFNALLDIPECLALSRVIRADKHDNIGAQYLDQRIIGLSKDQAVNAEIKGACLGLGLRPLSNCCIAKPA